MRFFRIHFTVRAQKNQEILSNIASSTTPLVYKLITTCRVKGDPLLFQNYQIVREFECGRSPTGDACKDGVVTGIPASDNRLLLRIKSRSRRLWCICIRRIDPVASDSQIG